MLVDRAFGADLLTMFTVDYEIGGAAQAHDHPFEETYFFLAGEVEAELDGEHHVLAAGRRRVRRRSAASTASATPAPERVRWLETQAPQPPARHAYRWARRRGDRRAAERPPARRAGEPMMSDDGAVVVVGGTRAIGLEIVRHYAAAGREVVLTGRDAGASRGSAAVAARAGVRRPDHVRPGGARVDRAGPGRRRAGPRDLVLVAIDRDQNSVRDYDIDRALRLVTLKLVGYTEVVHALLDRLTTTPRSSCSAAWRRSGRIPARRRSRRSTAASSGLTRTLVEELRPIRVNSHPSRGRRRQPVLGGAPGRARREHAPQTPDRPAGDDGTTSSAPCASCSRTAAVNGVELIVDGGISCV